MVEINAQMVKDLRDQTGAGMMDCKKALAEAGGNIEQAITLLRKKGLKDLAKRAGKVAAEGVIYSYIHTGSRVGVMLELNSETDFVARGDDFQDLAKRIAMHIAWSNPRYVDRDEVPQDVVEREKEVYLSQLNEKQRPMADKILPGKLDKFYQEVCLMEQVDARETESKKTIGDLVKELSAKVGEKVVMRRFIRFEVGEGIEKVKSDFAEEVMSAVSAA